MNYRDGQTPMQLVQGKAVMLETLRYYLGSVFIGGLCGAVCYTAVFTNRHKKESDVRHR